MNWRQTLLLFLLGFAVAFAIAQYQTLPGYMDADYYFAGGMQLANGKGFAEPYIWNYLSDPQQLPAPSHTYWMPLASILSGLGMWLASQTTYSAGRFPFILLSACVPVLTATLTFSLSQKRTTAFTAGLLSIFSAFYAPFMPVPDNYAIYMLLGAGFLLLLGRQAKWVPLALGVLAGLMTLARTDGLLWLGLGGLAVWLKTKDAQTSFKTSIVAAIPAGLLVLVGYLLVMAPYHYRNWTLFDTLLTPGGGYLLWLTDYRETFVYPASVLTRDAFLEAGMNVAIQNRLMALVANINTILFSQGELFLLPFILIGLWRFRNQLQVQIGLLGWFLLFLVMSIIFPFAGTRGSFHHAGAAIQPLLWGGAAIGLDIVIAWMQKHGRFTDAYAVPVLHGILVILAVAFTGYLVNLRVVSSGWAVDDVIYASVEDKLSENGISPMDVVIVRNPPGYYVRTGRSAILLPFGDEAAVVGVAKRYQATFLILEDTNALGDLRDLYDNPNSHAGFVYLGEVAGARLFKITALP